MRLPRRSRRGVPDLRREEEQKEGALSRRREEVWKDKGKPPSSNDRMLIPGRHKEPAGRKREFLPRSSGPCVRPDPRRAERSFLRIGEDENEITSQGRRKVRRLSRRRVFRR